MTQHQRSVTSFLFLICMMQSAAAIIVLEYAGNITHAGRAVGDYFERGITLQLVHHLQKKLSTLAPTQTYVIIDPLCKHTHQEKVAQTNTLQPMLVIQLHAYQKSLGPTECDIFYYTTSVHEKPLKKRAEQIIWYNQIHQISLDANKAYASHFFDVAQKHTFPLIINHPLTFPFAPLSLYAVPAVALEIGLMDHNLEPIIDTLATIIAQLAKE